MGDDSALGVSPEENFPEEVESDDSGRPEFTGLENHHVVVGVEPGDDLFLCIERVAGADLASELGLSRGDSFKALISQGESNFSIKNFLFLPFKIFFRLKLKP